MNVDVKGDGALSNNMDCRKLMVVQKAWDTRKRTKNEVKWREKSPNCKVQKVNGGYLLLTKRRQGT